MRQKSLLLGAFLALLLAVPAAWGDEIILKGGRQYSGKFIRGDSNTIVFRILSRDETFSTSDVSEIVFKEPQISSTRSSAATTAASTTGAGASTATGAAAATGASSAPWPSSSGTRASTAAAPQPQGAKPAPEPTAAPVSRAAATGGTVTLPVGTPLTIRTTTVIDTDRNRVGDSFDATLDEDVVLGDEVIFSRGTPVRGRIAYAKESGRISGQSQLILELTEIDAAGKTYNLETTDYTEVGSSRGKKTAATVGGTAALGAIIGAIAGGGKGAAVGAASGAAVGTGVQVLTKGQTLKVPAETILEFRLQSSLTVQQP